MMIKARPVKKRFPLLVGSESVCFKNLFSVTAVSYGSVNFNDVGHNHYSQLECRHKGGIFSPSEARRDARAESLPLALNSIRSLITIISSLKPFFYRLTSQ